MNQYVALARPFLFPVAWCLVVAFFFDDPTYRFPLFAALLPGMQRAAARTLGVHRPDDLSKTERFFVAVGFAGFVVGWLLLFAVLVFALIVGVFSLEGSGAVLQGALIGGAAGLVLAAWFWWPWYARDALANWPRTDAHIWTASGNRWDRLFLAWRMQKLARSGGLRWRGFGATTGLVAAVTALAAVGVLGRFVALPLSLALIASLPLFHIVIAREANALCEMWAERPIEPDSPDAEGTEAE